MLSTERPVPDLCTDRRQTARSPRTCHFRGYLKTLAKSTWQVVSWLTHASNAVRYDGTLAVDATYAVLNAYGAAILRHERPTSDRCSRCGWVQIQVVEDLNFESGLGIACGSCGFVEDASQETAS